MRDIRLYIIRQLKTVMQSMMKSTRHLIIMIFWLKSSDRKMIMEKSSISLMSLYTSLLKLLSSFSVQLAIQHPT